ncbi:hypothetical protein SUGI_0192610 [Cryptomeria japonica]|uniref:protein ALTERED SEED GERMINATION 2 isoform X1 n=2 Tax=Cryptomeria japonica TaxID=3369 RepID=UPI002408E0EF|nr:protein ALTERED SEED GERMINATION 2 isoform X1 [Cryptomeria japonica]GLJ12519.1 hypothetical protein SUGI_0192610 [Cryptomeria japonica]
MKPLKSPDGNIFKIFDGRSIDPLQMPYPYSDQDAYSKLQMHSSLIEQLELEKELEGHQGCVNALAWNSKGSLLVSGSDDTRVNIWSYASKKLLHSIETGHSTNIFCCKFVPETGDELVVSGAGDAEVRVFRLSQSSTSGSSQQTAVFRCHSRRVKKIAVEEGNPHVVWSASEDGTLRQHDFRESVLCPAGGSTNQECRNVLLDLRSGAKKFLADPPRNILALKSCDISTTRPHQLLVGGSDAFARLYDRRMLPPLSSSRKPSKPPPCVCYFCPAHLSDYGRSSLHLTHVTFSPNGEEILLSYSGEHVYLMDVNNGQDSTAKYTASDLPKRMILSPVLNGTKATIPSQPIDIVNPGSTRALNWLKECRELLQDAQSALEEDGKCLYVIEATSEILDAGRLEIYPALKHDCLCTRAAAFLKRSWRNDSHMAIRDCNEARSINPVSVRAHIIMADALSQLGKHKDALDYAMRANFLDPTDSEVARKVRFLREQLIAAEDSKNNKKNDGESKLEKRSHRVRSLSELLFRSEASDSSHEIRRAERDDSDYDDDMDVEMEFEMSVSGDEERDTEPGIRPGSLNLRVRRRGDSGRESSQRNSDSRSPPSGMENEDFSSQMEIAVDMRQRYVGHCNVGTDIKQASFLGRKGDFVASGSDDGRWFIWHKRTGRLMKVLTGDENVVNCVQCHPFDSTIATSGIDSSIKIWNPCANVPIIDSETEDLFSIMAENQHKMRQQRDIGLPFEILQRFSMHDAAEGTVHPFECTPS